MMVIIDQPRRYYCPDDEDHFIKWLYGLPAFQDVRGTPAGLEISFSGPIDRDSMYRLIGLLKRYSINLAPLKALSHPAIEGWLKDKATYWHAEMFGDDAAGK